MTKNIAKIIWTALALVGVVLVLALVVLGFWKVAELIRNRNGPVIVYRGTVLQAIEHVNKQIFIQHNIVADIEYTDTP